MKVEVLKELLDLNRPTQLITNEGDYIYNTGAQRYERLAPRFPPLGRSVSTIESLLAYIHKYYQREQGMFPSQKRHNGRPYTIIFNRHGAVAMLDDGQVGHQISFNRVLDHFFKHLQGKLNRELTHKELVKFIQLCNGSFSVDKEFVELLNAYRRVSFDKKVTVISQPIVESGRTGDMLTMETNREGIGAVKIELPQHFTLSLSYAAFSPRKYDISIEIESELKEKDGKSYIVFSLDAPYLDSMIEQAVKDEIADLKAGLAVELPEALVVVNLQ